MEYNFIEIGERIAKERKAIKYNQDDMCDYLHIGRNRLSAIENGKCNCLDTYILSSLCKLFKCEMGYLLCEYDTKERKVTDISNETGLSTEAIERIINWKLGVSRNTNSAQWSKYLSLIICDDKCDSMMDSIVESAMDFVICKQMLSKRMDDSSNMVCDDIEDLHNQHITKMWYASQNFTEILNNICDIKSKS